MISITLETMPVSTNRLYTSSGPHGRKKLTPEGRGNKTDVSWEAHSLYRAAPLEGKLRVTISMYWKDNRNHDIDNIKGYIDALSGILWVDDSQIVDLHLKKFANDEKPRVEIKVYEI